MRKVRKLGREIMENWYKNNIDDNLAQWKQWQCFRTLKYKVKQFIPDGVKRLQESFVVHHAKICYNDKRFIFLKVK